jgi:uncharacterized LabA/DUF88 family protein
MLNLGMYKEQKVGILIDVQNMYYSGKNLYNSKLNYEEVIKAAVSGRKLIRAVGYTIKADVKDEKIFHSALENMGIEVKTKDLLVFHGGHKKGDWDVGLAVDAIRMCEKVDSIIVISGDGDFKDMYEYVKQKGCRIEVVAFGKTASSSIKDYVDRFVDLDKDQKRFLAPLKPSKNGKKTDYKPGVNKAIDEIMYTAETNAQNNNTNSKVLDGTDNNNSAKSSNVTAPNKVGEVVDKNQNLNKNQSTRFKNNKYHRHDKYSKFRYNNANNNNSSVNNSNSGNNRINQNFKDSRNNNFSNNKVDENLDMPTYSNMDDSINDLDFDPIESAKVDISKKEETKKQILSKEKESKSDKKNTSEKESKSDKKTKSKKAKEVKDVSTKKKKQTKKEDDPKKEIKSRKSDSNNNDTSDRQKKKSIFNKLIGK